MSTHTTVLVVVAEDIIVRNILTTDYWLRFKESAHQKNWRLVVVTEKGLADRVQSIVGATEVVTFHRAAPTIGEKCANFLARNAINSHTNAWEKMRAYSDGQASWVATQLKRALAMTLGRLSAYKRLLRRVIRAMPLDVHVEEIFTSLRPNVCIVFSLTNNDVDVQFARVARAHRVPVIGMVRSWDNLTSHGLLRVVPDSFVFQNRFLKKMAHEYQAIDEGEISTTIVGLPHYDRYFAPKPIPKETLFSLLGLDPNKKLIVYGAMGEFLFRREADMPRIFERALEAGLGNDAHVLFRAHPSFAPSKGYGDFKHVTVHVPTSYTDTEGGYSNEDILISSVVHADLVVTCGSTFAIDAFMLDRFVICIAFDGDTALPYWDSAQRFYDQYTHYEAFMDASKIPCARSADELAMLMQQYLDTKNPRPELRRAVIDLLAAPFDGHAGDRLASTLIKEISRLA